MEIKFSHEHTYTPEWRGNSVAEEHTRFTAILTIMNVADLMFLLDTFESAGVKGSVEVEDIDTSQLKPILTATGHLLPRYVALKNLTNTETGESVTIEEVVNFPFFLNLAAELLMKLSEISAPSDDDVGNSNAPPVLEQTPVAQS